MFQKSSAAICALLLPLLVPACDAQQVSSALQLEVDPASLELMSCQQSSHLLVIARNPTSDRALNLRLSTIKDLPLEISAAQAVKELGPGQETFWQLEVECTSDFVAGAVQVVLSNELSSSKGQLSQIVVKPVTVKLADPPALENMAGVEIKSTLDSLMQSGGDITVVVTNKTIQSMTIDITPTTPAFIKVTPSSINQQISPFRTATFPFKASAQGRIKPGKQILIFNVRLSTSRWGTRDFLVSREVTVAVLGESEMLKLLGLPSLLFLPGFLAVSSFLVLWRWGVRPKGKQDPPLQETTSGFWLVSITTSLVITGVFLFFVRPDFFSFYGLGDLMTVWVVSIVFGCTVSVIYRAAADRIMEKREQALYPQPGDTPIDILRKLKQYNGNMAVRWVKLKGTDKRLCWLPPYNGFAYVCPQMVLVWESNADAKLRKQVEDQLKKSGDPSVVASTIELELLKKNKSGVSSVKEIDWDKSLPLFSSPQKIDKTALEADKEVEEEIILRQV